MDVRVRVGLNLQRLRREKGFSQEDLAHLADVHQTYVSDLERGKRNPSIQVLDRLAKGLGVDFVELCKAGLAFVRTMDLRPIINLAHFPQTDLETLETAPGLRDIWQAL